MIATRAKPRSFVTHRQNSQSIVTRVETQFLETDVVAEAHFLKARTWPYLVTSFKVAIRSEILVSSNGSGTER